MKEFLSQLGLEYVERNVEQDDSAYAELVAHGWRAVPVTLIGQRAVKGFDEAALRAALSAAGALPSPRT